MKASIHRSSQIVQTPRVVQVGGIFDCPIGARDERRWDVELPIEDRPWNIGLIVGPSGAGKSTILGELFQVPERSIWDPAHSVLDAFPAEMPIKDVTGALSAVGFSSPPSWMRPYQTLSNGEQFRVDLARTLVEAEGVAVVDEFTSVVDRTVAKVGSAAVAKFIRRADRQFVAAACHYDIIDWLQPDWVFDLGGAGFSWRHLQRRPRIDLEIFRVGREAWSLFHRHHYLSASLSHQAVCFMATVDDRPAAFASAIPFIHPTAKNVWREHRTVTLPDFQGVGIGNALSEFVAGLYRTAGKRYRSVTSSPAMVRHRARSNVWNMDRKPGRVSPSLRTAAIRKVSADRVTASFEYVGPGAPRDLVRGLQPLQRVVPFAVHDSVTVGDDLDAPGDERG